jgi:hypothetical protein
MPAIIHSCVHSYPAFPVGTRTGTPSYSLRSSRTMSSSSQCSCAYTGYGPNCPTTFMPKCKQLSKSKSDCWSSLERSKNWKFKSDQFPNYLGHRDHHLLSILYWIDRSYVYITEHIYIHLNVIRCSFPASKQWFYVKQFSLNQKSVTGQGD